MGNLYSRIHSLVLDKGMTDGSACAAVGLPRSTLGSLKTGKTKSLSQKNLKLFAELFKVSVDSLLNEENSVDDLAASVQLAMYDGQQYEQVPEDIKQLAAAFALAKKQQEIQIPSSAPKNKSTNFRQLNGLSCFSFCFSYCKTWQNMEEIGLKVTQNLRCLRKSYALFDPTFTTLKPSHTAVQHGQALLSPW